MDPISVILSVLAAGALVALQETANQAVKEAYAALKSLIRSKIKKTPMNELELILSKYEKDSITWEKPLGDLIKKENLDRDQEIVEKANALKKLLVPRGNETKNEINVGSISNSTGFIVGTGVITNTVNEPPNKRKGSKS